VARRKTGEEGKLGFCEREKGLGKRGFIATVAQISAHPGFSSSQQSQAHNLTDHNGASNINQLEPSTPRQNATVLLTEAKVSTMFLIAMT
jgi:hypothetical protein